MNERTRRDVLMEAIGRREKLVEYATNTKSAVFVERAFVMLSDATDKVLDRKADMVDTSYWRGKADAARELLDVILNSESELDKARNELYKHEQTLNEQE